MIASASPRGSRIAGQSMHVVIVGTGNMGRSHLRSLVAGEPPCSVDAYDRSPASREATRALWDTHGPHAALRIHASLDDALATITPRTVVIVATTADGRLELIDAIAARRPAGVLAEKPLCQTWRAYEAIEARCHDAGVPVHLNFGARMQPFYQQMKETVAGARDYLLASRLPRWGMACVGIHHFDLIAYLFDETDFEIVASTVDEVYEQKRAGFFDVAGMVAVRTPRGYAVVHNAPHAGQSAVNLITELGQFSIFEEHETRLRMDSRGVALDPIAYHWSSRYTRGVTQALIDRAPVALPDLAQGRFAHRMLFAYLARHGHETLHFT